MLTVYLDEVGGTKKVCVGQDGMSKADIEANGILGAGAAMALPISVKTGESYYIYVAGSKGRFCGAAFEEGAVVEPIEPEEPTETPEPSIPEAQEYVWTMSAAYNNCPAGTELMKGLTTLFADTKANGKYITSNDNGNLKDGVVTGTALKYAAEKNGTLTVSFTGLGTPSTDGSFKTMYIVEEGGKQTEPLAKVENPSATDKLDGTISAEVVAGTTYYIYGAGTRACFNGATFAPAE